jgi:NAD(P)-dependent dehydrogenase (short-subunit alcohol dehydrogenase family)
MSKRLQDRVAIVTGAGQGIGAAIAHRFVGEGARVVIAELNAETGTAGAHVLREEGHAAIAIQTNVGDAESVARMVAATFEHFGPPDILINNAGINVFSDPLTLSEDDWRRCFNVDLDGVWYCCQAVLPHMLDRGRGSIVNIASIHSFQIIPHCFPYPVAKHGLIGLNRALAVEYAGRGVRVNAVCPSYVETQIAIDYWNTFPDPAAERRRIEEVHPMNRIGQPEEVAAAVLFLASDEASFITGASLMVDGGGSLVYHQ